MPTAGQSAQVEIVERQRFVVGQATHEMAVAIVKGEVDRRAGGVLAVAREARLDAVLDEGLFQSISERINADLSEKGHLRSQ